MTKEFDLPSGKYVAETVPNGANRFQVFNDEKPYLSFFVGVETHTKEDINNG